MPRKPRIFIEGGVYHVYNRFARGGRLFADPDQAGSFLALLRRVRDRDDLTIFAWCVMPNHYHLAVRAGPVPLARSIGYVQFLFGRELDPRRRATGPRWQSRYQAKLVRDPRYLRQLMLYIHVNPVSAGVVRDLSEYRLSSHPELLGKSLDPLADVSAGLSVFGDSVGEARRRYLEAAAAAAGADWAGESPGRLPWWRREPDRPIEPPIPRAWIDESGLSTGRQRPRLDAATFLIEVCRLLQLPIGCLAGPGRNRRVTRARFLAAGLAVERWGVAPKALAEILGRWPEVVCRWANRAGHLRLADEAFRRDFELLDSQMSDEPGHEGRAMGVAFERQPEAPSSLTRRLDTSGE